MKNNDNDDSKKFTNPFVKYKIINKMSIKKTPVLSLMDFKAEKLRATTLVDTSTGKARCLNCKHEWTAEVPTGAEWLECPACSLMKGRFIHVHEREDPHWTCHCGCNLFMINSEGCYCPNCGIWQDGFLDTITRT